MLLLYRLGLYLALPLIMLRLCFRGLRDPRYFERMPQRLGFVGSLKTGDDSGRVWIHAVSVGEVNAAAPLVNHLLRNHPRRQIIVTTMTPTGAARVAQAFAAQARAGRIVHCYLPFDYPGAVKRFLAAARPALALVMETEIWPNLIARCHHNGVPMMYLNARLSARSHRGYRRLGKLIKPTLRKIHRFAAQAKPDAKRLIELGALPAAVLVTGSLKFDVELAPRALQAARSVRRDWGLMRPVWIAGSTHDGEEAQLLETFARLRKEFKSLLLVIAPRHPQRFGAVLRLCRRHGCDAVLRSQTSGPLAPATDILIADSMGELPMLIAAGDLAFIGGSLVEVGGHNVLEAAAAGVPVVFGPHMFNFADIADMLLQHAAGVQVRDVDELTEVTLKLLRDPSLRKQYASRGKGLIQKNRGALGKICRLIAGELRET